MAWAERFAFDRWGRTALGEILEVGSPGARGPIVATFRYTATTPEGQTHTYRTRRFVTAAVATSLREGAAIRVVYLPDQPAVADILGNRFALLGDLTWSTIILGPIALGCAISCWLSACDLIISLRQARGRHQTL
ncbi:MAG: hypothetical protein HGA45_23440 [Chloroflexales bacterium]|nr:hypothetical protein [Chloroflexales bacterium]